MSAISSREKNILLITVVIVLYALAAISYKKQAANWKIAQRIYKTARQKVAEERALISDKDAWDAKYAQMRELMPPFPYDKDVDTHWLNLMDDTALKNGFTILRRQTNKELEVGDVYELPIECRDWEAPLEALVKFLYALQQKGAMLDVRQLFIRPSNKPGYLKGSFTLYCAYMRSDQAQTMNPAPVVSDEMNDMAQDAAAEGDVTATNRVTASQEAETQTEAPAITNTVPQGK